MSYTLRQRIAAFLRPVPPAIIMPTELDGWCESYIEAGWKINFFRRDKEDAKYLPYNWRIWITQETRTSGCETIRCEHDATGATLAEAMRELDAMGVLASPDPAVGATPQPGAET